MNKNDFITLDDLNRVVNQCFGEAKREIKTLQSRVADLQEQVKEQERRIKFLEGKTGAAKNSIEYNVIFMLRCRETNSNYHFHFDPQ